MDVDDLFVVEPLGNSRSLCLSTLAVQTVEEAGATHLGGDRGLFIYELDESRGRGGVEILAKAVSLEAAFRLIDLWKGRFELPAQSYSYDSRRNLGLVRTAWPAAPPLPPVSNGTGREEQTNLLEIKDLRFIGCKKAGRLKCRGELVSETYQLDKVASAVVDKTP